LLSAETVIATRWPVDRRTPLQENFCLPMKSPIS
jgi:hypothetical protein